MISLYLSYLAQVCLCHDTFFALAPFLGAGIFHQHEFVVTLDERKVMHA